MTVSHKMLGYLRQDSRKGIRNYVAVCYLVECAQHVARAIANPFEEGQKMADDKDVNAGRILEDLATLAEVGREVFESVIATAQGKKTASENLGHQEFVLTYKYFEPLGPSCLPLA
jgi:altronate dehydratase large subunit